MPTSHPRITITLTETTSAALEALSKATDQSKSSIVAELLDTAVPVFERVTKAVLAVSTLQKDRFRELGAGLERAQEQAETALGVFNEAFDSATLPLFAEAEAIARRARKSPPAAVRSTVSGGRVRGVSRVSTPVPVTRGSGTPSKARK